jgi:protein gp37
MAEATKIEWCDHTHNHWTGCTKVSDGCAGCYAEGWAKRSGVVRWGPGEPRRLTTDANRRKPLIWNAQHDRFFAEHGRRQRVFCSSLADVFDNEVDPAWRADLFQLIERTPQLDWLLLTKRVGNAARMITEARGGVLDVLTNVWLGATVVNQAEADRDVPKLLTTPAAVRFLSIEPMLGPIDVSWIFADSRVHCCPACGFRTNDTWETHCPNDGQGLGQDIGVDWVIAGGESGPHARPAHPQWFRDLRDQCAKVCAPFLFKQWGEWASVSEVEGEGQHHQFADGATVRRVGKKKAGRLLDGMTHDGFPR